MPRPSRVAIAAVGVAAIVVAGLTTGGVLLARLVDPLSPTTTVTADDGTEVVLDWADYPGAPETDPDDVLAAPRAEEVEAVAAQELDALEASTASAAPELAWVLEPNPNGFELFPSGGNGYGGDSLHQVLNSGTNTGTGLREDRDWHLMATEIDAGLAALGYGPVAWDFEREPFPGETQAQRDADVAAMSGSLDPDEMWIWMGTATRGSMWASVSIWDERRDTAPAESWGLGESGVSFFLGGTVISEDDEQAYRDGVAPFEGLSRPATTHSD